MRNIDLIAIVLELAPMIEKPKRAANWYGKAAQSLMYDCMCAYHEPYANYVHGLQQDGVPFTTSTLLGRFIKGCIHPRQHYYLRLTGMCKEMEMILYNAIQPGGFLGIGTIVELAGIPFSIENLYWENRDNSLCCYSSYHILQDYFLANHPAEQNRVKFRFATVPIVFQNGGFYNPLISPEMIFRSLLRKWNHHAPEMLPDSILDFLDAEVFVSQFNMQSQAVQQEGLVVGGKGELQVETKRPKAQEWAALRMLAAFGYYSGVGKNTSRGFGILTID